MSAPRFPAPSSPNFLSTANGNASQVRGRWISSIRRTTRSIRFMEERYPVRGGRNGRQQEAVVAVPADDGPPFGTTTNPISPGFTMPRHARASCSR